MKYYLLSLLLILAVGAQAQTSNKTSFKVNGHTISVDTSSSYHSKSTAVATGYNFVDKKGVSYPVYKSINGKYFYNKVSAKSGNPYKVYLTDLVLK